MRLGTLTRSLRAQRRLFFTYFSFFFACLGSTSAI